MKNGSTSDFLAAAREAYEVIGADDQVASSCASAVLSPLESDSWLPMTLCSIGSRRSTTGLRLSNMSPMWTTVSTPCLSAP